MLWNLLTHYYFLIYQDKTTIDNLGVCRNITFSMFQGDIKKYCVILLFVHFKFLFKL